MELSFVWSVDIHCRNQSFEMKFWKAFSFNGIPFRFEKSFQSVVKLCENDWFDNVQHNGSWTFKWEKFRINDSDISKQSYFNKLPGMNLHLSWKICQLANLIDDKSCSTLWQGMQLVFSTYCQSRQALLSLWTSKNLFDTLVPKQLHDVVDVTRTRVGRSSVILRLEGNDLIISGKLAQPFPGQQPLNFHQQLCWQLSIPLSVL